LEKGRESFTRSQTCFESHEPTSGWSSPNWMPGSARFKPA
jgi:hypothetical protein